VVCSPRCARSATTHTRLCRPAVGVHPARRAAWLCLPCPFSGAGFLWLLFQPGQERRVSEECLNPALQGFVTIQVFALVPDGVVFYGVSFRARSAPS